MEAFRGLSVEELPLIEWDEAARHVNGGGEKDELFLIELLSCFFTESGVRLRNLIAAALAYRSGETHIGPKTVETVIREEAHALKGSAANVRLLRVAKASENIELPIKSICPPQAPPESVDQAAKRALLHRLCFNPDSHIGVLVREFRGFVSFMEGPARDKLGAMDEAVRGDAAEYLRAISSAKLEEAIAEVAGFWVPGEPPSRDQDNPPAGAALGGGGGGKEEAEGKQGDATPAVPLTTAAAPVAAVPAAVPRVSGLPHGTSSSSIGVPPPPVPAVVSSRQASTGTPAPAPAPPGPPTGSAFAAPAPAGQAALQQAANLRRSPPATSESTVSHRAAGAAGSASVASGAGGAAAAPVSANAQSTSCCTIS